MTTFDLMTVDYLALVTASDVESDLTDAKRPKLAIYAPGTICADRSRHRDAAASLHFGFLMQVYRSWRPSEWGFLGPACCKGRCSHMNIQPWRTALKNRHPFAGTKLKPGWRRTTQRRYWKLVPALALMWQTEPHKTFLRGYLKWMTTGKHTLSDKQRDTIIAMLQERGASRKRAWSSTQELAAHTRVILRRRNLAFRLGRLAALDLTSKDGDKVSSLQKQNVAWKHRKRMKSLTKSQEKLIGALEASYRVERAEATRGLAERLAVKHGIEPL